MDRPPNSQEGASEEAAPLPKVSIPRRRLLVLYNCAYETAGSSDDRSAFAIAALQVRDAVEQYGYEALIRGVHGHDLARSLDEIHAAQPELVFNLTESLNQDS